MSGRQLSLLPRPSVEHGGEHSRGRRKTLRPLDPKRPIHLVLRSSRAHGSWSLLHPRHVRKVGALVHEAAQRYGLRLYRYANVGNHLHLLVKTPNRSAFQAFLRELSGRIAFVVTGAKKGNPVGRFWDFLAYTRVATWGRDFRNLELYFIKNLFEAAGLLTRRMKAAGVRPIPLVGWLVKPPPRA